VSAPAPARPGKAVQARPAPHIRHRRHASQDSHPGEADARQHRAGRVLRRPTQLVPHLGECLSAAAGAAQPHPAPHILHRRRASRDSRLGEASARQSRAGRVLPLCLRRPARLVSHLGECLRATTPARPGHPGEASARQHRMRRVLPPYLRHPARLVPHLGECVSAAAPARPSQAAQPRPEPQKLRRRPASRVAPPGEASARQHRMRRVLPLCLRRPARRVPRLGECLRAAAAARRAKDRPGAAGSAKQRSTRALEIPVRLGRTEAQWLAVYRDCLAECRPGGVAAHKIKDSAPGLPPRGPRTRREA
jgi:hypothetical protein